jgi:hypothetical protein
MPDTFDFHDLRCFASAKDASTWHFMPRHPDVQRGNDGRALLTLIDMGATAYLLFTATWGASQQDLQDLRREIASRTPGVRAERVELAFAPVASVHCNVLMGDGRGSFDNVASSKTSGYPPYDAAFNVYLQGERLAHAKAALQGEAGRLALEYCAELRTPVSARAQLTAHGPALVAALAGAADRAALRQALDRAVESGIARVVIDGADPGAATLAAELYDRVLDRAAEMLPRLMRQGVPDEVRLAVALEQEIGQATSAFADVGTLLAAVTMNPT